MLDHHASSSQLISHVCRLVVVVNVVLLVISAYKVKTLVIKFSSVEQKVRDPFHDPMELTLGCPCSVVATAPDILTPLALVLESVLQADQQLMERTKAKVFSALISVLQIQGLSGEPRPSSSLPLVVNGLPLYRAFLTSGLSKRVTIWPNIPQSRTHSHAHAGDGHAERQLVNGWFR